MRRVFSAADFVEALASERLDALLPPEVPTLLRVTGLVKLENQVLLFSPGILCWRWIKIPQSIVKEVEYLGKRSCDDHEHHWARLHLTIPADSEIATAFGLLAQSVTSEDLDLNRRVVGELASDHSATERIVGAGAESVHLPMVHGLSGLKAHRVASFDRWKCARCVAANLALGIAVAAAVAALGPAIGASTAVSSLMAQFGISESVAILAVGGANGSVIAHKMCDEVC